MTDTKAQALAKMRMLELENENSSVEPTPEPAPVVSNENGKQSLIEKLMSQGGDIVKGLKRGGVENVVGFANMPSTAHNILRPEDEPVAPAMENLMEKPETQLGKGAETAASLFGPGMLNKGIKMMEGTGLFGALRTGIKPEIFGAAVKNPQRLGAGYKSSVMNRVSAAKKELEKSPVVVADMDSRYQKYLTELVDREKRGGVSKMDDGDLAKVIEMSDDIKNADKTVNGLQGLKEKWQDEMNNADFASKEGGAKIKAAYKRILDKMQVKAQKEIADSSPELGKANKEFSLMINKKNKKEWDKFDNVLPNASATRALGSAGLGVLSVPSAPLAFATQSPKLNKLAIQASPFLGILNKYGAPLGSIEEMIRKRGQ